MNILLYDVTLSLSCSETRLRLGTTKNKKVLNSHQTLFLIRGLGMPETMLQRLVWLGASWSMTEVILDG